MNKNFVAGFKLTNFILFLLILNSACNEGQQEVAQYSSSSQIGSIPLFSETDTIITGNESILFTCTTDLKAKVKKWSSLMSMDTAAHKDDSGYLFTLQNGGTLRLANSYAQNEHGEATAYQVYSEYWNLEPLNHWLFEVTHYEYSSFELIDKADGEILEISNYPIVSPKNNKMIVAPQNDEMGDEFNGIELLRIHDGVIERAWTRELNDISLSSPRWIDNDTVVFNRLNLKTHKKDFVKACIK